ncbi:MAG: DUF502 domain-containing protein [Beijerinckiaceae bacterium]|nr:DUF502 domain-containing protein [Beijerinckiaceae bacterium]
MTNLLPDDVPPSLGYGPAAPAKSPGLGGRIRNWFLTGVIVAGPLATTVYIVWWFIDTIDNWVRRLVPVGFWPDSFLPFQMPGLGVVLAFFGLTLLGFLAANLAGRTFIKFGEAMLARMPVVRSIYKGAKQIFETVFSSSGTTFRKVGMIEFPGEGKWSLVFICTPPGASLASHLSSKDYTSVFLPCTPNPTTGFYFFLPANEVIELSMSPDDAVKLIVSCGVIQPDTATVLAEISKVQKRASR